MTVLLAKSEFMTHWKYYWNQNILEIPWQAMNVTNVIVISLSYYNNVMDRTQI